MRKRLAATLAVVLLSFRCSGSPTAPAPSRLDSSEPSPTVGDVSAVLVGAGDIAACDSEGKELTARLLDRFGGTIFTTGDNAYPNGTAANFTNCYGPSWGRHRNRTRPTPGNHEYDTQNAAPYFEYFGANAGMAGSGYYSYQAGSWHVVALNSEIDIGAGSRQEQWLRAELAANPVPCTVAYWHRPRFSSGNHGDNPRMQDAWRLLYESGVELVITGHDHLYERFAPQDASGRPDHTRGIRQFIVGTGGGGLTGALTRHPNSEVIGTEWGVLALTLQAGNYRWEFVPVEGGSFRDAGTGTCH